MDQCDNGSSCSNMSMLALRGADYAPRFIHFSRCPQFPFLLVRRTLFQVGIWLHATVMTSSLEFACMSSVDRRDRVRCGGRRAVRRPSKQPNEASYSARWQPSTVASVLLTVTKWGGGAVDLILEMPRCQNLICWKMMCVSLFGRSTPWTKLPRSYPPLLQP